jgi:hypothetical protein
MGCAEMGEERREALANFKRIGHDEGLRRCSATLGLGGGLLGIVIGVVWSNMS